MKITKALLLSAATIFATACSDDDDKKSSLESAKISFSGESTVVKAPQAMQQSEDPHAQMATGWVQMANGFSGYLSYFEFPAGAAKSSTRITASNGRSKETGDVLVYTWSDEQTGATVAYQVSEESDKYVWEIFLKESGSDWVKYFHAEEQKDGSSGFMKIYNIYSDDASQVIFTYEWSRNGNELTFKFSDSSDNFSLVIKVNEQTGAGSVVMTEGGVKVYEMIWDANGDGSWIYYDEEGNVEDSGTWEA